MSKAAQRDVSERQKRYYERGYREGKRGKKAALAENKFYMRGYNKAKGERE